jgi:hypothetical protein
MPRTQIALLLLMSGCFSEHTYRVDRGLLVSLEKARGADPERVAVPATRAEDQRAVFVRSAAVTAWPSGSQDAEVRVVARRSRPMVIAGAILTGLGVAILSTGIGLAVQRPTVVFDGTEDVADDDTIPTTGKALCGVGSAATVAGAILLGIGLGRRPEEVGGGRSEMIYLSPLPR